MIYGVADLGAAIPILTAEEWGKLRPRHRVDAAAPPYKKTFGLPVLKARSTSRRIPFHHPTGAIGIVRHRRV